MSDAGRNDASPPPPPGGAGTGCGVVFMIVVGIVLLLPGLCAVIFIAVEPKLGFDPSVLALMVLCIAVGIAGIWMIRLAVRRIRGR